MTVGRRTTLLLATTALAMLLSSGVALAVNTVNCEPRTERCVGTDRPDLMRGTSSFDNMLGRDGDDTLKGFGRFDFLRGQMGDDRLFGGLRGDFLVGGEGDDKLRGEESLDGYAFARSEWGDDTIIEDSPPRNYVFLPFGRSFTGPVTTTMISSPAPEVNNAQSGSTVQWDGEVIRIVEGSSGDDNVTGTARADDIADYLGPDFGTGPDTDTVSGGAGADFLFVLDGDSNDTVTCGPGNDTVFFDEGATPAESDTLLDEPNCEEQNPEEGPDGLEVRQSASYREQILEDAPDSVVEAFSP
jgi:Ca2+-binding RTX toxin-like protein